jgi:hypothetical protein
MIFQVCGHLQEENTTARLITSGLLQRPVVIGLPLSRQDVRSHPELRSEISHLWSTHGLEEGLLDCCCGIPPPTTAQDDRAAKTRHTARATAVFGRGKKWAMFAMFDATKTGPFKETGMRQVCASAIFNFIKSTQGRLDPSGEIVKGCGRN